MSVINLKDLKVTKPEKKAKAQAGATGSINEAEGITYFLCQAEDLRTGDHIIFGDNMSVTCEVAGEPKLKWDNGRQVAEITFTTGGKATLPSLRELKVKLDWDV